MSACSIASRPSATRRKTSQFFLEPMAQLGDDPLGSMGTDTPIAVLSRKPKLLYNYFKQNFAQVTNPPIDPIREELVMSLVSMIGPRPNLLGLAAGTHKRLEVSQPVLTNADLDKIRSISELVDGAFRTATIDITWDANEGAAGLKAAIERIRLEATEHVLQDINILILSDRAVSAEPHSRAGPAGAIGGTPQAGAPGPAYAGRSGRGDGRSARGAPLLHAGRLRRRGCESLSRL